ncbi:Pga5 GPI-anchored beta-1,3-glucanosyltransferase [Candida orthopsilosis Co 90-125]|uniref:1,3-beta-glucanosyltransferase n=1 Tax=Candida orthopsilosis (strain 90-125) TaxID=1136231 RepID=H8X1Q9_CANO9|nr:Pga5 GPI-anchored beta-1,3-glucanosyltransferase [Candida orthopsilosis Co 90-125]CCG22464.1 Pga5 GPI-anchored beta-1,3-glucanosyltransferase [Candida orthopsilosis Co 90-125]
MHKLILAFITLATIITARAGNQDEDTLPLYPIKVVGNKFYNSGTNEQFFIKGIAYQKSREEGEVFDTTTETNYIDPLANPFTCLRDLQYLKELGVNVVRIYQINPNANHDVCMEAFAEAGIYVLADLSEPYVSIRRDFPRWDTELMGRYQSVVDALQKYDNVLGFFAGNEVANSQSNIDAVPFVRSAVRDVKQYIHEQEYRKIPVGYASNDDASIRANLANYFVCDLDDEYSQSDFFAINVYEWCGYSTYMTSGYRELTAVFANYPAPVFFSEFGCNIITPRPFTEVETLFGSTMRKTWSGGIAYEYFEEVNHYGVVQNKKDGTIVKLPDFETLKTRFNAINPIGVPIDEVEGRPGLTCDMPSDIWKVSFELPPTPDIGKCECLWQSLSCVVVDTGSFDEESLLKDLCFKVDCDEINANGRLGKYGKYSDCNPMIRVSYALNKYYEQTGRRKEICTFQARGEIARVSVDLSTKFSTDGRNCQTLLDSTNRKRTPEIFEPKPDIEEVNGINEEEDGEKSTEPPKDQKKSKPNKSKKESSSNKYKTIKTPHKKQTSNVSALSPPFKYLLVFISSLF